MCEKKVICDALRTFGIESQVVVAIEEMSELQKELCKMLRSKTNVDHIAEEIADVEIMLAQMVEAFGISLTVDAWKEYKLHRLESRLDCVMDGERKDNE